VSALGRRLLTLPITLLGVVTLVFFFVHAVPGDPIDAMLGESAIAADREALRRALGLDRPVVERYGSYLAGLARGDLGRSVHGGVPVAARIVERLPATVWLALAAAAFAIAVAIPLGTLAGARRGGIADRLAGSLAVLGAASPTFVTGPVLVLGFAIGLGWFPVSGADEPASVVLPAVTLGLGMAAILTRLTRSALVEVLGSDFVRTARAKGLAEPRVVLRHGLRNALLSVTTMLGLQLGSLLGGAVVTETIFAWPGLGRLTLEAIQARDYPLIQGCVLVIALATLLVNTATDWLYARLDPRIRLGAPGGGAG
jgi:peptide/nickel transport system permease protein